MFVFNKNLHRRRDVFIGRELIKKFCRICVKSLCETQPEILLETVKTFFSRYSQLGKGVIIWVKINKNFDSEPNDLFNIHVYT